jgi:ribulose-phosphate 3-epimerase
MVLIMSVNPGFSGQKFIPETLNKLQKLKKKTERIRPDIDIQVDGGINPDNISKAAKAGANIFVAGSAVFSTQDYKKTIQKMKSRLGK